MLNRLFDSFNQSTETTRSNEDHVPLSTSARPSQCSELIANKLYELYSPAEGISPEIQVVLFHGYQHGNSSEAYFQTWTSSDDSTVLWPNWLAKEFTRVRILSVSYDSSLTQSQTTGKLDLYSTAENLLQDLMDRDQGLGIHENCPVVMIGKDLGCFVIEEICIRAECTDKYIALLNNVKGFVFYGPPFMGIPNFPQNYSGELAPKLQPFDKEIARLNHSFLSLKQRRKWKMKVMIAAHSTSASEFIPESSSIIGADVVYTLDKDMLGISKPASIRSKSFLFVRDLILDCLNKVQEYIHECHGLPEQSVGLIEQAEELECKLREDSVLGNESVGGILGITGMGGIGKTALAKQLFNKVSREFEYTCFIEGVKDFSSRHTLDNFLKQNFYRLGKSSPIDQLSDLKGKKTMIVMDDIASDEQIQSSIPRLEYLGKGSVIVITTRNRQEVKSYSLQSILHEVEFLHEKNAERLLCQYAFQEEQIPKHLSTKWTTVVQEVIKKCDGLPLTLEVMGKYFSKKNLTAWQEAFQKLTEADSLPGDRHDKVWAKLQISYEALAEVERDMFLDIATFFANEELETALAVWSHKHGCEETGWNNLVSKSLVKCVLQPTPDYYSGTTSVQLIWMHEHLRDLGKKLAEPQLQLTRHWHFDGDSFSRRARFARGKYLDISDHLCQGPKEDFPKDLHFLRWSVFGLSGSWRSISIQSIPVQLSEMRNLAVLELVDVELVQHVKLSKALRILKLSNLVQPLKFPNSLRILKLSHMTGFVRLPQDLGSLSFLRVLCLKNLDLGELPDSMGDLSCLVTLVFYECRNFTKLPHSFGDLSCLVTLVIVDCENFRNLPHSFGNLKSLQYLRIDYPRWNASIQLQTLPHNFGQLSALKVLKLEGCSQLQVLPENIGRLSALKVLQLTHCTQLQSLPESISELSSLEELEIDKGKYASRHLQVLPEDIGRLSALKVLTLKGCTQLQSLPESIGELSSLEELKIVRCHSLQMLPDNFGRLSTLKDLSLGDCGKLQSLPESIGELSSLKELGIWECHNLQMLPDNFGRLSTLKVLSLRDCGKLQSLPESIGELSSLEELRIWECHSLQMLPDNFGRLSTLKVFSLGDCDKLRSLPESIGHSSSLERMSIPAECSWSLPESFGQLQCLKELTISARSLNSLPKSMEQMSALKKIEILCGSEHSEYGKFPPSISGFSAPLILDGCHGHGRVPEGLENLTTTQDLTLNSFETLPPELGRLPSLRKLTIRGSYSAQLKHLPRELGGLSCLQELSIDFCPFLEALPGELGGLSCLQELSIDFCPFLEALPGELGNLSELRKVSLENCSNLRRLPERMGGGKEGKGKAEEEEWEVEYARLVGTTTGCSGLLLSVKMCPRLDEKTMQTLGWVEDTTKRDPLSTVFKNSYPSYYVRLNTHV